MGYETIDVNKKNGTGFVFLNRPDVHNAMNEQLMIELTECFVELSKDKTVRMIVLTGRGKSFCAGADLHWMKSIVNYTKEENIRDSNLLLKLFTTIHSCPKPVIGRINGHAFGGGLGLLAVCDISIGIPNLKFAFSEVNLGIIPSVISSFISRRMTLANMRRFFITGERFDSTIAHEIGLLDFIVPIDELDKKIEYYLEQLRSSGPLAVKEIKHLIYNLEKMNIEDYKKHSVEKIAELRVSKEGQEGISAFLEKRKAKWRD